MRWSSRQRGCATQTTPGCFSVRGTFSAWLRSHGRIAEAEALLREFFKAHKIPVDRTSITGRTAPDARIVQIADVLADPEYTWTQAQKIGGYRAALGAPLLLKGSVIGVIFVGKAEPTPFTERQVELVTVFADQGALRLTTRASSRRCRHAHES
jgi:two-component system, NtrC family, sensor kinase